MPICANSANAVGVLAAEAVLRVLRIFEERFSGGHHRFNPPSLRGVAWTAPYLHDGRAATLADVLRVHLPGKTELLKPDDQDDLIAFLESL